MSFFNLSMSDSKVLTFSRYALMLSLTSSIFRSIILRISAVSIAPPLGAPLGAVGKSSGDRRFFWSLLFVLCDLGGRVVRLFSMPPPMPS